MGAGGRRGHASIPSAPSLPGMTLCPLAGTSPSRGKLGRTCTELLSHLILISGAALRPTLLRAENLWVLSTSWPHQGRRGCPDRGRRGSRYPSFLLHLSAEHQVSTHLRGPQNQPPRCLLALPLPLRPLRSEDQRPRQGEGWPNPGMGCATARRTPLSTFLRSWQHLLARWVCRTGQTHLDTWERSEGTASAPKSEPPTPRVWINVLSGLAKAATQTP